MFFVPTIECAAAGGCEALTRKAHKAFLDHYQMSDLQVPLLVLRRSFPFEGEAPFARIGDVDR